MRVRALLKLLLFTAAGGVLFQNPTCTRPDIGRILQQAIFVDAVLGFPGGGSTILMQPLLAGGQVPQSVLLAPGNA